LGQYIINDPADGILTSKRLLQKTIRGCVNVTSERRAFAEKLCPLFLGSALEVTARAIATKVDPNVPADEFKRASTECREEGLGKVTLSKYRLS